MKPKNKELSKVIAYFLTQAADDAHRPRIEDAIKLPIATPAVNAMNLPAHIIIPSN
jgi:hypothetical protein